MRKITFTPFVAAAFACSTAACQKLPEPTFYDAKLKVTAPALTDAIPAAYGQLVSVTPSVTPYVAVMWVRKPDESIVAVRINYARAGLGPNIIEISRK